VVLFRVLGEAKEAEESWRVCSKVLTDREDVNWVGLLGLWELTWGWRRVALELIGIAICEAKAC
jgi:hypothetical protein